MASLAMSTRAPAMSEYERSLLGACSEGGPEGSDGPSASLGLSCLGPRLRAVRSAAALLGPPG